MLHLKYEVYKVSWMSELQLHFLLDITGVLLAPDQLSPLRADSPRVSTLLLTTAWFVLSFQ
jgi:hypothetical protein